MSTGTRRAPPPAFLVYAANLIVDRTHKLMSLDERGLRITMMMECWCNGSIPSDTRELARVLGLEQAEVEKALTSRVMQYFDERDDVLVCPELLEYRQHLDRRHAAQSKGGEQTQEQIRQRRLEHERRERERLEKERLADSLPASLPASQPPSSLIQPKPLQPNPSSLKDADTEEDKQWVQEFTSGEPDFMGGPAARTKPGMRG